MLPRRLRRLHGFTYVGPWRYSLTFCTNDRRPAFLDAALVALCLEHILRAAAAWGFEVYTYCFMPDHLHLLVHGASAEASLPRFVKTAKQMSGYDGGRMAQCRLWQTGYFERVLRETEDSRTVAAYILNNPVRAGIVQHAAHYTFSGSGVCEREELFEYVMIR